MRILIYSAPFYADSDFPLVKALRSMGHEVCYMLRVAPFMTQSTLLDFVPQDPRCQVLPAAEFPALCQWGEFIDMDHSYVSNYTQEKTGFRSFRLLKEELRTIRAFAPDAVCYMGLPYELHYLLLLAWRKRSTTVMHDPFPHSGDNSLRNRIKRRLLPLFCKHFILLNGRQAPAFAKAFHVAPRRITVSSLGSYQCYRHFLPGMDPGCGPYILFLGRLAPYKGIDDAVKAFSRVRDQFPDLRLVIAGAGPLCFDMQAVEADERISLVHRHLSMEEVAGYVSHCQFVVCPYTDATQSGVIQTAFALGAPVVATEVGNFADVVIPGVNGLLVPPRSPEALAGAFEQLLAHPEALSALKANLREATEEDALSWQKIAQEYLKAFAS